MSREKTLPTVLDVPPAKPVTLGRRAFLRMSVLTIAGVALGSPAFVLLTPASAFSASAAAAVSLPPPARGRLQMEQKGSPGKSKPSARGAKQKQRALAARIAK
jgi:hypothetical protein